MIGRPVELAQPQMNVDSPMDEEQAPGGRFFNGEGYTADIDALRIVHPGLRTLEKYLREAGWENLPVLPMPAGGA